MSAGGDPQSTGHAVVISVAAAVPSATCLIGALIYKWRLDRQERKQSDE
jgi:hypothetical protein